MRDFPFGENPWIVRSKQKILSCTAPNKILHWNEFSQLNICFSFYFICWSKSENLHMSVPYSFCMTSLSLHISPRLFYRTFYLLCTTHQEQWMSRCDRFLHYNSIYNNCNWKTIYMLKLSEWINKLISGGIKILIYK